MGWRDDPVVTKEPVWKRDSADKEPAWKRDPVVEKAAAKPPVGVLEDVARATGSGFARGTIGIPGMLGDVQNIGERGAVWLRGKIAGPEEAEDLRQSQQRAHEADPMFQPPTSETLIKGATDLGVPGLNYRPETTLGRFAGTIAENAPSALIAGPGGLLRKGLAQAVLPGVLSEGAGQLAESYAPEYETAARVVGAVAGGVAGGAGAPRGAHEATADALRNITPEQVQQAQALMARADVPLTFDEALNSVTRGGFSRGSQLARVAANSGGDGGARFDRIYGGRADAVRGAVNQRMGEVAPNPYPTEVAAARGREAAETTLRTVRGERSAATRPHYLAGEADQVPPAEMQAALAQVDALIAQNPTSEGLPALQNYRRGLIEQSATPGTPATRQPVPGPPGPNGQPTVIRYNTTPATPGTPEVPYTGVGELERRLQAANEYREGYPTTVQEREARRLITGAAAPVNAAVEAASPATRQGRAVHQQISRDVVEPIEQGPVGRIEAINPMQEGASAAQGRQLMGVGEQRSTPMVDAQTARLAAADPRAVETMARDYIGSVFTQAAGDTSAGARGQGGAVFRARLAGDPTARANLEAVISHLPNGRRRWEGFGNLLDTLEATGYRPAKGSDTAFNQQIAKSMREGGSVPSQILEQSTKGGLGVLKALGQKWENYRYGGNSDELARLFTDPNAAPLLEQLARHDPKTARARAIALRLMQIGAAQDRSGNTAQPVEQDQPMTLHLSPGRRE